MNNIKKTGLNTLGYGFVTNEYLKDDENEYVFRVKENNAGIIYRKLKNNEIKLLEHNGNFSSNWNLVEVTDIFDANLIENCKFYGWVRIGNLEAILLDFKNLRLPVGLYNSIIVSCDFGHNVSIHQVNYVANYIFGNEVILANVNEMTCTNYAKFGNGIIKEGEEESNRIWLEVCNENGARAILPFNGMQPGDAFLWATFRSDEGLLEKFKTFTNLKFSSRRGYYGKVGHRTVIKNCRIIKDVLIGSDAYIKGANKLKNLTINSDENATTQIGEGCELVNGIIGFGCRIFYGVKGVRFVMGSNAQLKYGARLINSYLGDNSTISCCEVLNSLIFPFHEQHHNNSFLIAALICGQSNMAAGATIGSNHNTRGADGEMMAARGFWPALCVSTKHNSKFASYTFLAKGDYPHELNIKIPFSLVSNDTEKNKLIIMPAYWFLYNMYAINRNSGKFDKRDKRAYPVQQIEKNFLAPDTVNEIVSSLKILEQVAEIAYVKKNGEQNKVSGKLILGDKNLHYKLEFFIDNIENSKRKVEVIKMPEAYQIFKQMINYYAATELLNLFGELKPNSWQDYQSMLPKNSKNFEWINVGGQLMDEENLNTLVRNIKSNEINNWDKVHDFYQNYAKIYASKKCEHAFNSLLTLNEKKAEHFNLSFLLEVLQQALVTKQNMVTKILEARTKDYHNPFIKMMYKNEDELEKILGSLSDNSFIHQQKFELDEMEKQIKKLIKCFS